MVTWLMDKVDDLPILYVTTLGNVGVASRHEVSASSAEFEVIDVSDLVETGGNDPGRLKEKLMYGVQQLATDRSVIVVCDKGIVRSSMFALYLMIEVGADPDVALARVVEKVGSQAINLDLMQDLQKATRKKRILVTGGTGFIGSNLLPVLSQQYQVVSYPRAGLNLVEGPFELHKVVEAHGIDLIIHLAHPRSYNLLPSMPEALVMMRNVLEVCRVKKLPLLYLSSLSVFGKTKDERAISSDDAKAPEGVYGQTKYLCETLAETYWVAHDVKTAVLRPSYVYGKGMDEDSVICKFVQKAKRNEPIIVHRYNNGCQVFDFLHVNDLIPAIMFLVEHPGIGPLNIGTGVGTSIRELAEIIIEATASKSKIETAPISKDAAHLVVNPDEASKALGWRARIPLKDGLKELL